MSEGTPKPRVFVSYSWTNDEHVEWVVRLAERLVSDGVDVILDQWDLKEGQDKHAFMEQMVSDPTVTKVLAVCDKLYSEKADGRKGGVGTETQIISPEVYTKARQEKFIPLVREWSDEADSRQPCLPVYFKNAIYVDFSDDEKFEERYERLLRNIYGRPERKKPQLGQPPAHLFADNEVHVKTAGKLERLRDAVMRGRPHTPAMLRDYLRTFADSMEDFRVAYKHQDNPPFGEVVLDSISTFTPYRDSFVDLMLFATEYMNDGETYDAVFEFLESILPYKNRPEGMNGWSEESFDNYRFILYELFLHFIAVLLKVGRFKEAARFIEAEYHYPENLGGGAYISAGIAGFNEYCKVLEQGRNYGLKLNRPSVIADLVMQRATHPRVRFPALLQADFLLFLRPFFPNAGASDGWNPRCLVFASRSEGTFELFGRATSAHGFKALRELLKVSSLTELDANLSATFKNRYFIDIAKSDRFFGIHWERLLNLEKIRYVVEKRSG